MNFLTFSIGDLRVSDSLRRLKAFYPQRQFRFNAAYNYVWGLFIFPLNHYLHNIILVPPTKVSLHATHSIITVAISTITGNMQSAIQPAFRCLPDLDSGMLICQAYLCRFVVATHALRHEKEKGQARNTGVTSPFDSGWIALFIEGAILNRQDTRSLFSMCNLYCVYIIDPKICILPIL